jgi:DNA-directed RNA polymerase specialized sigma24 family protein
MASPSNEERFRALFERHHPAIIAYFVRRIGSQDAVDAADDVFAVAWRRINKVPEEDETLRWLYGVAHNVLANRRRGERRSNRKCWPRSPKSIRRGMRQITEGRGALTSRPSLLLRVLPRTRHGQGGRFWPVAGGRRFGHQPQQATR